MLTLFSQAAKHETGLCHVSGEPIETRVGTGTTVFSKYISIGDDMWTALGTIHYVGEEEHTEEEQRNEGAWTDPEPVIHLQEVRSPSSEATSVSQGC